MEAGSVDLLEDHVAALELAHHGIYVIDLEGHLGERARRCPGRLVEDELAARGPVEQAARALVDWLQPELVSVEAPGALQVLGRQAGGHACVGQHLVSLCVCAL